MEKIIFGDNQFFAVNHISDEKSRAQSIQFKDDAAIIKVLNYARESGVHSFMCTTHDRIANICDFMRKSPQSFKHFTIYPCMPYAHKYANAVTELGIPGTIKKYAPGSLLGSLFKGGVAYLSKDYMAIMQLLIDAEMKAFQNINTPVIFLQNVMTDLLLGLGMTSVLKSFHAYAAKKYGAEAGFITMNLPKLVAALEKERIYDPIICASINKAGFRMSGGKQIYEHALSTKKMRVIAMQVFAGGTIPASEAIEYISSLPNIQSILFGASSKKNIEETVSLIHRFNRVPPAKQLKGHVYNAHV